MATNKAAPPSGEWWTIMETAAFFGFKSRAPIQRLIADGKLVWKKLGTVQSSPIRISAASVEKYMESK